MAIRSKSRVPRLSDAEWTVMKPLWEKGPLAARDLYAALPRGHGWSHETVKTMLARLVKKGAVAYTPVGNSYLYQARFAREEIVSAEVKDFKRRVLDGALAPFLVNFFEGRPPSDGELEVLEQLIRQSRRKKSGR